MPSIIFFQVGSTDLTQYVDIQNFNVNSAEVYETWTDGNYVEHREISRSRITGKIKLGFKSTTELNDFLTTMSNNRNANGYYTITVHVNNLGSTSTISAFVDQTGAAKWDVHNGRQWLTLTLEIRGR